MAAFAPKIDLCLGPTGSCGYLEDCAQEYGSIAISDLDNNGQLDIMLGDSYHGGDIAILFGNWDI